MPPRREPKSTYVPGRIIRGTHKIVCTKCSQPTVVDHVCSLDVCGCGGPCEGGCSGILGRGGMATVYRAIDVSIEYEVALKILHERAAPHLEYSRKQFRNEAKTLAQIGNETLHVVRVITHNFTDDEHALPYYVMEMLRGRNVRQIIARCRNLGKEMPLTIALGIVKAVATALGWTHEYGIVHRDVTPANVFITERREPKLIDFGVAGRIDDRSKENTKCKGTLSSMSPEQFEERELSPLMDIYALGILLFELVTLQNPYEGCHTKEDWVTAHLQTEAPRMSSLRPGIPLKLDELGASALAKDPKKRPQNAHQFMRLVAAIEAEVAASDESLDDFDELTSAETEPSLALAATLPQHLAGGALLGPGAMTASAPLVSMPVDSKQSGSFWTNPRARQGASAAEPPTSAVSAVSQAAESVQNEPIPALIEPLAAIVPIRNIIVGPAEPVHTEKVARRRGIYVHEPKIYMDSPLESPFVRRANESDEDVSTGSVSGGNARTSEPDRPPQPSAPVSPTPRASRSNAPPAPPASGPAREVPPQRAVESSGNGPSSLERALEPGNSPSSLEAVSRASKVKRNAKDYEPIPRWQQFLPTRRERAAYGALGAAMIALLIVAMALGVFRSPAPHAAAPAPLALPDERTAPAPPMPTAEAVTPPRSLSAVPVAVASERSSGDAALTAASRPRAAVGIHDPRQTHNDFIRDIGDDSPAAPSASAYPRASTTPAQGPAPSATSSAKPLAPPPANSVKVGPGF